MRTPKSIVTMWHPGCLLSTFVCNVEEVGKGVISYSEEEVVPEEFISTARLEGVLAECKSPSGSGKRVAGFSAGRDEGTGPIGFMEN